MYMYEHACARRTQTALALKLFLLVHNRKSEPGRAALSPRSDVVVDSHTTSLADAAPSPNAGVLNRSRRSPRISGHFCVYTHKHQIH